MKKTDPVILAVVKLGTTFLLVWKNSFPCIRVWYENKGYWSQLISPSITEEQKK